MTFQIYVLLLGKQGRTESASYVCVFSIASAQNHPCAQVPCSATLHSRIATPCAQHDAPANATVSRTICVVSEAIFH